MPPPPSLRAGRALCRCPHRSTTGRPPDQECCHTGAMDRAGTHTLVYHTHYTHYTSAITKATPACSCAGRCPFVPTEHRWYKHDERTCTHTHTHTHTHTRTHTRTHTHTYTHTHARTCTHTHARTCTHTHARTCTHTHARTCTRSRQDDACVC